MTSDNNSNNHPKDTTTTTNNNNEASPKSRKRNRDDNDNALLGSSGNSHPIAIPTIHRDKHATEINTGPIGDSIAEAFAKHQAVYLPQYYCQNKKRDDACTSELRWNELSKIYEGLLDSDKESFCIENSAAMNSAAAAAAAGSAGDAAANGTGGGGDDDDSGKQNKPISGSDFLNENSHQSHPAGYCSFLVQNDAKALEAILERLPVTDPVAEATTTGSSPSPNGWGYEPCLWIFFGRNDPSNNNNNNNNNNDNDNDNDNNENNNGTAGDLPGRPEHTDQISHDGTWHYQLSGTKRWLLRPTPQLLRQWKRQRQQGDEGQEQEQKQVETSGSDGEEDEDEDDLTPQPTRVDCQQGDVLIVNTRLWRHQTVLPPQPDPSVSYARDFWIGGAPPTEGVGRTAAAGAAAMTNVDGLYAMDDIEEDTVLFREDNMPDCELHRSKKVNANCKVVELEDGLQAVVSARFIAAGEFFCIPESSDEEDDEYEEGDEGSWGEVEDDDVEEEE